MGNLRVNVIDRIDQCQNLTEDWSRLLAQSKSDTIFLTWEWLYSWARIFLDARRKLFILSVQEKNEVIGLAPWYIDRFKIGPFCGYEIVPLGAPETGSDYLDVIVKRGREKEVANCLYDFLYGEAVSVWDRLAL